MSTIISSGTINQHDVITQDTRLDLATSLSSVALSNSRYYDASSSLITDLFWFISYCFYTVISNILYYIPTVIISILTHTFQFSLSFTSILLLLLVVIVVAYGYVRYIYLTKYSRLPEEPKRQEPTIDTFLEPPVEYGKSRVSYIDEFLSAIKIFGYLDKSVFHELTKSMQTQKLDSGEILFLDDTSGFTICVDGEIQVYFKVGDDKVQKQGPFAKDNSKDVVVVDGVRYQLLNNVKSGAPVSSFIGVLSLLTNQSSLLRYAAPTPSLLSPESLNRKSLPMPSDGFALDDTLGSCSPAISSPDMQSNNGRASSRYSRHSTKVDSLSVHKNVWQPSKALNGKDLDKNISPTETDPDGFLNDVGVVDGQPSSNSFPKAVHGVPQSINNTSLAGNFPISGDMGNTSLGSKVNGSGVELIAIPKGNCTISIIPRESFIKIAHKYPKATTHIIDMILTKLYRVTFQTANDYLDLTSDIFETELNLNNKITYKLPGYLHDTIIESLDLEADSAANADDSNLPYSEISTSKSQSAKTRPAIVIRSSRHFQNSSCDGTVSTSPKVCRDSDGLKSVTMSLKEQGSLAGASNMQPQKSNFSSALRSNSMFSLRSNDEGVNSMDVTNKRPSLIHHPSSSARHFTLKSRNKPNPGDLVSNAPLPKNESDMTFDGSKFIGRNDSFRNSEEFDDSIWASALSDAISEAIGIVKDVFTWNDLFPSSSIASTQYSSQVISSLTAINIVPTVEEGHSSDAHKYLTTGFKFHGNMDDDSVGSNSENGASDYEAVKKDLADEIQVMRISKGTKIIRAGEQTPGIYYVIDGSLDVSYWKGDMEELDDDDDSPYSKILYYRRRRSKNLKGNQQYLFTVGKGEIAGYLGTLIGSKSFIDVKATETTYAAFVPRDVFDFMIERYPRVESCIAKHLLTVLDHRLYLTDYAMEWVHCPAGKSLYNQGDPANGIYVVLNGRFRSVKVNSVDKRHVILGEHGQGESLGEVEVLTKTRRIVTLVAIRDSELARIPRTLFELIALSNPSIMVSVSRLVANRVKSTMANDPSLSPTPGISPHVKDEPLYQTFSNFRTLTILPVTQGLPVTEFGERLGLALEAIGQSVKILNQSSALTNLGKHAFDRLAKMKQSGYFAELEEKYDIVLYLVDSIANSSWTKTCIQQGDCILLIADATASPNVGEYERLLVKTKTTARTELVLLHPERYVRPGLTNKWLKNRIWVHAYHHIQMQCSKVHTVSPNVAHQDADVLRIEKLPGLLSKSTRIIKDNLKNRVESIVARNDLLLRLTRDSFRSKKYYQPMQVHKDDFMRLARLLTGQSVGLVLGGGGARGISHVGIIKALEDNGIPVDMIGGTSIGAFVGGLYAKEYDFVPMYGRVKTFAGRMGSLWRSLFDLTIPVTSYITGHVFNRGVWKAFGESRIEDFWIKYYANSTNITESLMEVHTSGYAWRYIRASMSLASLLPPITDNGNMLLDGGYVDNLTVEEMKRRGAKIIVACDVGSADDRTPMDYGDSLSGFWVLMNRINPFSKHPNVPTMADIQMRLAYVASVNALDRAKNTSGCLYLRPPIEGYATLDFSKFDEIYRTGYTYGSKIVKKLKDDNEFPVLKVKKREALGVHPLRRRYSI